MILECSNLNGQWNKVRCTYDETESGPKSLERGEIDESNNAHYMLLKTDQGHCAQDIEIFEVQKLLQPSKAPTFT